jgi:D-inositol-3-phosphate glycosyltransferase
VRIALLGPVHPYRGGIAHYTAALTRALLERGHAARVFSFTRQYPRLLFPGQRQTDTSEAALAVPSERVIDSLSPLSWWRASRAAAAFGPTLVLVQWWHPFFAPSLGTVARWVRRRTGAQVVFVCHNVRPHEASRLDSALLRYAYGAADAFVVQARGEARRLRELIGEAAPVEVAPHPPYEVLSELAPPLERAVARARLGLTAPRVVLFFGLVREYKGLSVLLDAFAQLDDPGAQLVVAGEFYAPAGPYRAQVERLGLAGRVRFDARYIPNEEVGAYFSAADVVALPYRHATQSGIVQLAWAYGVPVVVSAVGGIPEVVEDGVSGLLVPPERPDALSEALRRFFAEGLEGPLREGVRQARRRHSFAGVAEAIERLHGRVVAGYP